MTASRASTICLALIALALAGCGGGEEDPDTATSTTSVPQHASSPPSDPPERSPACRAASTAAIERQIDRAGGRDQPLERTANDSLDLSICEYRERAGPDLYIKVTVDTAPQAAGRYNILLEEGRQRATFDAIPDSSKPHGVRGIGDDGVEGGVGAFWVKLTSQLTAVDGKTMVKVTFHVAGVGDERARAAASVLARDALEGA